MSTRAVYTFIDSDDTFHVYKHHDNYPTGAVKFIENALKLSWELPRFEADEFATGFIAANKNYPGNIRLTTHYERHGDLDWRYEIYFDNKHLDLMINVFAFRWGNGQKKLFTGTLKEFKEQAEDLETEDL